MSNDVSGMTKALGAREKHFSKLWEEANSRPSPILPFDVDVIDYKGLLKKYMEHVLECEGVTFVSSLSVSTMTEEEIEYMNKLNEEL